MLKDNVCERTELPALMWYIFNVVNFARNDLVMCLFNIYFIINMFVMINVRINMFSGLYFKSEAYT